jgi:rhodanese-related sulfurtransferase
MKKYLMIIMLMIFLFVSFAFMGCKKQVNETELSVQENLEQTSEETSIIEEAPTTSTEVKTAVIMSITPEEVFRIISQGKNIFLLDVRTEDEYKQGHIEGANLIPVQDLESRLDEIPRDRQIIVYCKSGVRSRSAASILIENGFGMVYDMGGISDWQAKGYPVIIEKETINQFEEITVDNAYQIFISNEDYLFIDVRSEDEYETSYIEEAVNIPVSEIESRLDEISKDKLIIVYCNGSSCSRSSVAASILVANGYKEVYNMSGNGILEWIEKGYPVVKL